MEDIHHIRVVGILLLVEANNLLVLDIALRLVKHAKHPVQPIVYLAVEQRYLHYYAVVDQAVDKRVFHAALNHLAIIVEGVVRDIHHRLVDVANPMSKQVHGYHGHGIALQLAFLHHVLLGIVLSGKITAEA